MSKESSKLRRLMGNDVQLVDMTDLVTYQSDSLPCKYTKHLSAALRVILKDGLVVFPKYKMIVLLDNKVLCYNSITFDSVLALDSPSSTIEFNDASEALSCWKKYTDNNCHVHIKWTPQFLNC